MNATFSRLTFASLISAASSFAWLGDPTQTPTDVEFSTADRASVERDAKSFVLTYQRALESGDHAAVLACLDATPRFVWFTDGSKSYGSPQEILTSLDGLAAAGMTLHTEYTSLEAIPLRRDLAYVHATFKTDGVIEHGEGFSFAGVITMLLERDADAAWRVVSGHTSTPGGPPSRE